MQYAYVLNKRGEPLMPCSPGKARILLKQQKACVLTPPTIEIVGFLGGAARFIAKPCLKQRVMRFPIIHYGCSA